MKTFAEKWSGICAEVEALKLENAALEAMVEKFKSANIPSMPCDCKGVPSMAISKGYEANFQTLDRAFKEGQVCLLECRDKVTKTKVYVICAINMVAGEYEMIPMAKMFDGNPYDELDPPK